MLLTAIKCISLLFLRFLYLDFCVNSCAVSLCHVWKDVGLYILLNLQRNNLIEQGKFCYQCMRRQNGKSNVNK